MTTFVLLYSGGRMPEGEAETKMVMDAWGAWMGKHQEAIVDAGNPFSPLAKTITANGTVTDGPVGEPASGYTVIRADSMDKAIEITKDCPVFLGGAKLSLYETIDVMAMAGGEAGHQH